MVATEKLISANSLRNTFRKRMVERFDKDLCTNEENCKACYPGCFWWSAIEKEPAVDAVEVVHGQWVRKPIGKYTGVDEICCSVCGCFIGVVPSDTAFIEAIEGMNYCPNCGADMRERKDNG